MHRIALLLLALTLIPYLVAADPLYKWVDPQGNVHYSDKPQPGAKKLALPPASTFTAPTTVGSSPSDSDYRFQDRENADAQASASDRHKQVAYSQFVISSPHANETLWNVTTVTVSVTVQPGFQSGDKVTITLDNRVQSGLDGGSATFEDLERGEHTVSANLQASDGTVLVAQPITFYIQRGTQKAPKP